MPHGVTSTSRLKPPHDSRLLQAAINLSNLFAGQRFNSRCRFHCRLHFSQVGQQCLLECAPITVIPVYRFVGWLTENQDVFRRYIESQGYIWA